LPRSTHQMKSLSLTPWRGPIFETLKPRNMIANETARERNTANKAAVSIIVLSYNRPAYLRSALESVAAQTERSIEVIAADDGSPDLAVDAVLEEFRARFDRYVYERAERNVGVVANLLRAVRRSSGTYVAVLSDDDVLEPAFAERLRATLDASPSHCAAFCNVRIIDAAGNIDPGETAKFTTRWSRDNKTSGTIDDFTSAALVTRMFQERDRVGRFSRASRGCLGYLARVSLRAHRHTRNIRCGAPVSLSSARADLDSPAGLTLVPRPRACLPSLSERSSARVDRRRHSRTA
jgi:glycosyltransferase involved in cell wall biosynthesis